MNARTLVGSSLGLAVFLSGPGLAGCSSTRSSPGDEPVGEATAAITSVPTGVRCIRITVAGPNLTVTRLLDVTAGESGPLPISGLPLGKDTFVGDAFPVACSALGASVPTWFTDPVIATVTASVRVDVPLVFQPNGRASVSIDFEDGGADAGLPNTVSCNSSGCVCVPGFGNCDGTLANGCEANLSSDSENCGVCGNACSSGACSAGDCAPADAGAGAVAAPTLVPTSAIQSNDFLLALSTSTPGATICYTLDGSTPSCSAGACTGSSATYDAAARIPINGTVTNPGTGQVLVEAIACMAGATNSPPVAQQYVLQVAAIAFVSPAPGTLPVSKTPYTPTATSLTTGATGYFTTDGDPPPSCAVGTPVTLPSNAFTVGPGAGTWQFQIIGCKPGYVPSPVTVAIYVVSGS